LLIKEITEGGFVHVMVLTMILLVVLEKALLQKNLEVPPYNFPDDNVVLVG